jgi:ABC-type transporter Mla MlaB component
MKTQALQYYMHDGPTAFRFELAGHLDRESARRLDQERRTASSVIGDRKLLLDMTSVTGADEQGRALVARWHRAGVGLVANSRASRALAESILGEPLPEPPAKSCSSNAAHPTWLPVRGSFVGGSARNLLLLLLVLVFQVRGSAATLKSETIAAWDDYLQEANAKLEDRVRSGVFLWTFDNAERAARVRGGDIFVAPVPGQNPKKVPNGLIHHWIGAMFVQNLKLDDVLEVTSDYDHYKEFYRPSVIESKSISRQGSADRFRILLMNKSFFVKTALETEYQAINVRLDERRFYSISRTTRVQEMDDFGQPDEHRIAEGEGNGYIWKLFSIARFQQADGGVYIELEAIALSRDIPPGVRLLVDPVVRRVSRSSLLISLEQTAEAARGNLMATFRSKSTAASTERMDSLRAIDSKKSFGFTQMH